MNLDELMAMSLADLQALAITKNMEIGIIAGIVKAKTPKPERKKRELKKPK